MRAHITKGPHVYRREVVSPWWDITEADWVDHGPNPRFAIYGGGTGNHADDVVFDKETGLVWERAPAQDKKIWDGAINYAYATA